MFKVGDLVSINDNCVYSYMKKGPCVITCIFKRGNTLKNNIYLIDATPFYEDEITAIRVKNTKLARKMHGNKISKETAEWIYLKA